jgi:hypothetical protein
MASTRLQRISGPLLRSSDFGAFHETLLLTAVATVLCIRTQLWLTNYPQLGGHGLHIAHLLWGGLFMLVAIGLCLTFLGRPLQRRAAIVGGVGFGFFIDELGKFITSDNNYFYKPAAALIYLIFVGLFLLARWIQNQGRLTPRESLANAIDLIGEATRHRFDERSRARAEALLARADPNDPLVGPVRQLLAQVETAPAPAPTRVERHVAAVRERVAAFTAQPWFPRLLTIVFAVWALLSFLAAAELALALVVDLGGAHPGFVKDGIGNLRFVNVADITASAVAALLVARGIIFVRRDEMAEAVRWFERALLVSILLGRVFAFYESQFGAVLGLAIDLLLLFGVRRVGARTTAQPSAASVSRDPLPEPAAGG